MWIPLFYYVERLCGFIGRVQVISDKLDLLACKLNIKWTDALLYLFLTDHANVF